MLNLWYLLCFCLLNVFSFAAEKIVVDTDAGGDDALALLMLLRSESLRQLNKDHFEIVGITCTYGNTLEEIVEANVLKTLVIANRTDIPVYSGAKRPLIQKFTSDNFFGYDGFGEMDSYPNITKKVNNSMHSSVALIELSKRYDGNLTIIVLGPMTNIALAIMLDENFVKRVKRFHVSGSSIAGMGNAGTYVDFNFAADPESNDIFLRSVNSSQLTLFPWETGLNLGISIDWRKKVLGIIESPYRDFINKVESISLNKSSVYVPSDPATVATYLQPHLIAYSVPAYVQVKLSGEARGSITVNYLNLNSSNAKVILSVNREALKLALVRCLTFKL